METKKETVTETVKSEPITEQEKGSVTHKVEETLVETPQLTETEKKTVTETVKQQH